MQDVTSAYQPKRTAQVFDLAEARKDLATRKSARKSATTRFEAASIDHGSANYEGARYHQDAIDAERPSSDYIL